MDEQELKNIVEAALLVADDPLPVDRLMALFAGDQNKANREEIRAALAALAEDYQGRGIELKEVASGFRVQASASVSPWLNRLWEERSPRYSRALLETIAIVAYRQPITRGEIEDIRGVAVSTNIMRTLLDREWVRVAGHRDVPGHPAVYTTTRQFLDYFNLKSLSELPTLKELRDLNEIHPDLFAIEGGKSDSPADGERSAVTETESSGADVTDAGEVSNENEIVQPNEPVAWQTDSGPANVAGVEHAELADEQDYAAVADVRDPSEEEGESDLALIEGGGTSILETGPGAGAQELEAVRAPTPAIAVATPSDAALALKDVTPMPQSDKPAGDPAAALAADQGYLDAHLAPAESDGESDSNTVTGGATDWGEEAAG